jgi:hypothetical protein
MIRILVCVALGAALTAPALAGDRPDPRPRHEFTTDEAFDAAAVPAYAGRHEAVYAQIERDLEAHVAALQRWVRQRSISAQDDGIRTMAELVAGDLRDLGFGEVAIVPTDGHPGVFGYFDAGAEKTLLVYMMYDVQPVEPNWRIADPFAGELVETELGTVLMARGATNQKGPQRAFPQRRGGHPQGGGHAAGEPRGGGRGRGGARLDALRPGAGALRRTGCARRTAPSFP